MFNRIIKFPLVSTTKVLNIMAYKAYAMQYSFCFVFCTKTALCSLVHNLLVLDPGILDLWFQKDNKIRSQHDNGTVRL